MCVICSILPTRPFGNEEGVCDECLVRQKRVGVTSIRRRSISDGSVTIEINMRALFQFRHETGPSDLPITVQVHANFFFYLSRDEIYTMSRI